jgi:lipoate-protein ligase A
VIRRLDLGRVGAVRSQAIYHGLAEAMGPATPDTIVFCAPAEPYFCVGYHQDAARVLDLEHCRRTGAPVLRRRIGGGAVYLDQAQVFYQVIVHRSRAPFAVDRIYARYLAGPVEALRRLGLDACLVPPNEIEIGGRRVAGTGGGQIGDAVVVVGNVLLDFPEERMARAWRAPSAPFRRLARDGLRRSVTTLARELPSAPSFEALVARLAAAYADTLAEPLGPGELTAPEGRAIARAESELASEAFLLDGGGRDDRGLKIARGVYVFEGAAADGALRVSLRVRHGRIEAVEVHGGPPRDAERLLGRPVATVVAAGGAENPAAAIGNLLAADARDARPRARRLGAGPLRDSR